MPITSRLRPIPAAAILLLVVFAAGCRADSSPSTGVVTGSSTTTPPTAGDRGWLEGEDLTWLAESSDTATAELAMSDADEAPGVDLAEPVPAPVDDDRPLEAGSIDDALDFDAYQAYRRGILDETIAVRPLAVDDPTVIAVRGRDGLPVLDAVVSVSFDDQQGQSVELVTLRTTADGTTRFLPDAHTTGAPGAHVGPWSLTVTSGGSPAATARFERGDEMIEVSVESPGGIEGSVPLDVHFLLDATGSMGDEIDRLRSNMASIAQQIESLPSTPDVRFGMTVYRDQGDVFVTRTFDLTAELSSFLTALDEVVADGGGDYPEALDEALADALERPQWRRDGAVELLVLIADAPPQVARTVETPYTESALAALGRGVKILPVAASGTDDQAEYVFRELAFVTGGRFVFMAYGPDGGGTATGDRSDITPEDYDQLPLDQLVVRLVEDEILALTGAQRAPAATSIPTATTQ